jgi:hypothetical protein
MRLDQSTRRIDWLNHILLFLLSVFAAAALYQFVRLLLGGLPWPIVRSRT